MNSETDEMLMAYVDGELDDETANRIERLLETSSEARHKVRIFRESAEWLRSGLRDFETLPLPDRVVAQFTVGKDENLSGAKITRLDRWRNRVGERWQQAVVPAMAASVALAVGLVSGVMLSWERGSEPLSGPQSLLAATLENGSSGLAVSSATEETVVTPLGSFVTAQTGYCREYEMTVRSTKTSAIACRDDDGTWVPRIEIHESLSIPAAESRYVPASGATDLVSDYLDRVGAGAYLLPAEEARLIDQGWQ